MILQRENNEQDERSKGERISGFNSSPCQEDEERAAGLARNWSKNAQSLQKLGHQDARDSSIAPIPSGFNPGETELR